MHSEEKQRLGVSEEERSWGGGGENGHMLKSFDPKNWCATSIKRGTEEDKFTVSVNVSVSDPPEL